MRNQPWRVATLLVAVGFLVACATQQELPEERLALIYPDEQPFSNSRFAEIAGVTLHYRLWSPPSEPLGKVILLHGVGGSTFSFERIAPELASAGYSVAAIDLPGFGYSDQALRFEHTAANRLSIVWTLIDRLDTDSNQFNPIDLWFVLGHQMGGEFAAWMATDRPGRVKGLALVATVIGDNRPGGRMAWFPPVRWALRSWLRSSLYTPEGVRELLEDAYGRAPTQQEVDGYLAPLVRDGAERALTNFSRTVGNETPDLASLSQPILAIWGTEDSWRSREDGQEQIDQAPNGVTELIEAAGHVPMDTHPDQVVRLFTQWAEVVSGAE